MPKSPSERIAEIEKEEIEKLLTQMYGDNRTSFTISFSLPEIAMARTNAIVRFLDEDAAARKALGGVLVP